MTRKFKDIDIDIDICIDIGIDIIDIDIDRDIDRKWCREKDRYLRSTTRKTNPLQPE